MPDHLGDDMRKVKDDKEEPEKEIKCLQFSLLVYFSSTILTILYLTITIFFLALDEGDIALLKSYVS